MNITEVIENRPATVTGSLMKKFISNRCSLGLLRFFVAHPNSRFSKLAIVHAIDETGSRLEVEKALDQLENEGILKHNTESNTCFFCLTREEPKRRMILELAGFDWRQWQLVLEHS
ncbi:MAG: hypothetical protein A2Z05_01105 [Chloroflexi bacterium RBG_16_60_22]|nr:MAG: hypothetical protein A2Z05_01105 [Chloroflexi bacterium RBG_16_60_22]